MTPLTLYSGRGQQRCYQYDNKRCIRIKLEEIAKPTCFGAWSNACFCAFLDIYFIYLYLMSPFQTFR